MLFFPYLTEKNTVKIFFLEAVNDKCSAKMRVLSKVSVQFLNNYSTYEMKCIRPRSCYQHVHYKILCILKKPNWDAKSRRGKYCAYLKRSFSRSFSYDNKLNKAHCIKHARIPVFTDPYSSMFYALPDAGSCGTSKSLLKKLFFISQ